MFRLYGLVGLCCIVLAYTLSWVYPDLSHMNFLFALGYWLFFDAIDLTLNGSSILYRIKDKTSMLFHLIFGGAMFGLLLDIYAVFISHVWDWYPGITSFWRVLEVYADWGIVLMMIYSSYRVFLGILNKLSVPHQTSYIKSKTEYRLFATLGLVGCICLILPFMLRYFTGPYVPIASYASVLLGIWFLCEFTEYTRHEKSLIKDILHGYWSPVLAIIVGGLVTGFTWEFMNVRTESWVYTNIPLSNVAVFGIPVVVLLGWPVLFVICLSFYRAVWKGKDTVW